MALSHHRRRDGQVGDAMTAVRFAGVALGAYDVSFDGQSGALAGVRAWVEEDGAVVRRLPDSAVSAVEWVVGAVRGQEHPREIYLVVEGAGFRFIVPVTSGERSAARTFAGLVSQAGAQPRSAARELRAGPGFARSSLRRPDYTHS
jgi:hypothetical protein